MSDDDFVRRLRAMRDVPPWKMHLTFDAPLRVQHARRESSLSVELIAPPGPPCPTCAGVGSVKVRYPDGWGRYTCTDCGGCGATA